MHYGCGALKVVPIMRRRKAEGGRRKAEGGRRKEEGGRRKENSLIRHFIPRIQTEDKTKTGTERYHTLVTPFRTMSRESGEATRDAAEGRKSTRAIGV